MRFIADPPDSLHTATVMAAYRDVVEAVGSPQLQACLDATIRRIAPVRRWYFFREPGAGLPRALAFHHEPHLQGMVQAYQERFRLTDPLTRVLADVQQRPFVLGVRPADIPDPVYRERYLQDAQIAERLSLVHFDARGSCVTNVVTSVPDGALGDEAIAALRTLSVLLFPLLERHHHIVRARAGPCVDVANVREALTDHCPSLSAREADVCARLAIGVPAKAIARELGIGVESVQTYRKRAFQRLSITRSRQLTVLLTH